MLVSLMEQIGAVEDIVKKGNELLLIFPGSGQTWKEMCSFLFFLHLLTGGAIQNISCELNKGIFA